MHRKSVRLISRALVAVIAMVVIAQAFAVSAQAAVPSITGSVTVASPLVPRSVVKINSDFGTMTRTGKLLFSTEVFNSDGDRTDQWTETINVTTGQRVTRPYNWNTSDLSDGTYSFKQVIASTNWATIYGADFESSSISLLAGGWTLSSSVGNLDVAGKRTITSKFTSPSNALGSYNLLTDIFDSRDNVVKEFTQTGNANGVKSFTTSATYSMSELAPGTYRIAVGVFVSNPTLTVKWLDTATALTVKAIVPPTTTTTIRPTTTTTVRPTTTTAAPTTTTTVAPTTTTTAAPTTTTTVPPTTTTTTTEPPTTTTVPSTTTTELPTTTTTVPPTTTTTELPTTTTTELPTTTTTVPPVTTTVPPTTTTTVPPAYNSSWELLGGDEFNDTVIDTSKWSLYQGLGNEGVGTRERSNVKEGNGELTIVGKGTTGGGLCMCAANGIKQTYGRYEFRAKMDKGNGYGPAVLLWPSSNRWPVDGEIDILEMPKGDRTQMHTTMHYGTNNSQTGTSQKGDFSTWHTYAIEWMPDHITFFLDGVAKWTTTNTAAIPDGKMFFAMQNDVGAAGHWISGRDAATPLEVNLHIDWVRIYK